MDHIDRALQKAKRERLSVRDWNQPESTPENSIGSPSARLVSAGKPVTLDEGHLRKKNIICDVDRALPANVDIYRRLRTLVLQIMNAREWTKLGITSPGAKAGKTLNAINLAMAIAREGSRKVLLVDADIRRPAVADTLGISPEYGLIDFVAGKAELEDLVLAPENIDNLFIIPGSMSGASGTTPEMIGSKRMNDVLSALGRASQDNIVIVDLPPTLIGDDVLALAPKLDALLLIVAEGITDSEDLKKTVELLDPFELVGTVLNNSMQKDSTFEGYYHSAGE